MKTIARYFGAVLGMSFVIWMITLGSYLLYKDYQAKTVFIHQAVSTQSPPTTEHSKAIDTVYQKTRDIIIQKAN